MRLAFALVALLSLSAAPSPSPAAEPSSAAQTAVPTAPVLLKQFDKLEVKPNSVRAKDPGYLVELKAQVAEAATKRAEIGKVFLSNYPTHVRSTEVLTAILQAEEFHSVVAAIDYCRAFADANPDSPAVAEALATVALYSAYQRVKLDEGRAMVDAYVANAKPAQAKLRQPGLLFELYMRARDIESTRQLDLLKSLAKDFPSSEGAKLARVQIARLEKIGKPFALTFVDAVSKKKISIADYKGKVVVIDFWATWCGPYLEEMPTNKELYAKYHDQGVEFIGVSLDQAGSGRLALLDYVKQNQIPWPQYYQGASFEGPFTKLWGIEAIPTVFVIDAEGNLFTYEGRGKLDKLLPKLLEKRDKPKTE